MTYSERYGYVSTEKLAVDNITNDLKTSIYNATKTIILDDIKDNRLFKHYAVRFFKTDLDDIIDPSSRSSIEYNKNRFKQSFQGLDYPKIYDFVEFTANFWQKISDHQNIENEFTKAINIVFERERAQVRIIDSKVVQLTSKEEIEAINEAVEQEHNPVSEHIKTAIKHFSDRNEPDYRNSIKESISAVEAAAKNLAKDQKTTLGQALKKIEGLDGALKKGFESIYGWTSEKGGMRHSLKDKDTVTEDDARLMLVMCSAFSNYLLAQKPND